MARHGSGADTIPTCWVVSVADVPATTLLAQMASALITVIVAITLPSTTIRCRLAPSEREGGWRCGG